MKLIKRSDRGALAHWWFTIDKALLSSVMLLMAIGVLVSMAASPPVAERIGLAPFHFFKAQMLFLVMGFIGLITVSFFNADYVRRMGFLAFI